MVAEIKGSFALAKNQCKGGLPEDHEGGPQTQGPTEKTGGGEDGGRYRKWVAAKEAAVTRYIKRAAAKEAAVTETGRRQRQPLKKADKHC